MSQFAKRATVNLSAYPDLIVIYLGMMAHNWQGFRRLMKIGPEIQKTVKAEPDGLLLHEDIFFGFKPLHLGMRQYWRDFDALEKWARSGVHQGWWKEFHGNGQGTGFWHEIYSMRGGMEALYTDVPPLGFARIVPAEPAKGTMFTARKRLNVPGSETVAMPYTEQEVYQEAPPGGTA